MTAEQLARLFHETYERLAPAFGYSTVKWEQLPEKNRSLMVATATTVLQEVEKEYGMRIPRLQDIKVIGPIMDSELPTLGRIELDTERHSGGLNRE